MQWLNYHHLLYFWTVARTGSIVEASQELMLAPPTISSQIRDLEEQLNCKLFQRKGRHLVLTDVGERAFSYANEIFSLGRELVNVVQDRPGDRPLRLVVGVEEAVPKLVAREILKPAFQLGQAVHVICREGAADRLLGELANYHLDIILSDQPARPTVRTKVFSHPLGECGVTFFGSPDLAAKLRDGFPRSLHGAPALLPTDRTALRKALDRWFYSLSIKPMIVGEFDDSALTKVFGSEGFGFFAVPTIIAAEIAARYSVEAIGEVSDVHERFYAISVERKLRHPAVVAITQAARSGLFNPAAHA